MEVLKRIEVTNFNLNRIDFGSLGKPLLTKQERYAWLVDEVKNSYPQTSARADELVWCKSCQNEINLCTYWQGQGYLDPEILVVGQDWGMAVTLLPVNFQTSPSLPVVLRRKYCVYYHLPDRHNQKQKKGVLNMKATGIVRRIDDLGRVVIPKEIRRTMRIREGDPSQIILAPWEKLCFGMLDLAKRKGWNCT